MNTAIFVPNYQQPNYQQIDLNVQQDDFLDKERIQQLEIIDKLRELGVGDDISLPQLVVVGDQSSGKSSLLEGLTGLPFPVASQLCTRFATKVSFRRLPTAPRGKTITITIIPAKDTLEPYKQKLASFNRQLTDLPAETFNEILEEAARIMGLPGPKDNIERAAKRFSSDVLKIEIVGPEQQHLSVVDVPGLYHNPTKQQTESDLTTVRALIGNYVQDRRTIILAVLDSRNNLANQEVFRIAKEKDPEQTRTIGVMTKLDALQGGDERGAINIAQNNSERLKLGWYCVRNRSTQEIEDGVMSAQRDKNEKLFFDTRPWNELPKERVGISSLRSALAKLLLDHIQREFPEIEKEIDRESQVCREKLVALGKARETTRDQMIHVTKLSESYQRFVENALKGSYWASGSLASRLRMHIQNEADTFSGTMHQRGATMNFQDPETDAWPILTPTGAFHRDVYQMISEEWHTSRGTELAGQINPVVLQNLFIHQTKKWEAIAREHLTTVIQKINNCNDAIFEEVCSDAHMRNQIRTKVNQETEKSFMAAHQALNTILSDERTPPLLTNNQYLPEAIMANDFGRFLAISKKAGLYNGRGPQPVFNPELLRSIYPNSEVAAVFKIHDTLRAYYQVALNRFIDNVSNQVIERYLLCPGGSVGIFTSSYVAGLSPEELNAIAGEDGASSDHRQQLRAQIARLEKAKRICAKTTMDSEDEDSEASQMDYDSN